MELRLLSLAIAILDPRKWRRRLRQLGGGVLAMLWVWYRSVDHAEVDRAVRDARREQRERRVRRRNEELLHRRMAPP